MAEGGPGRCATGEGILLIADEIATGFGRTEIVRLRACDRAGYSVPGERLTGGTMTLSATLTTRQVADTISDGDAGCFWRTARMFMGNLLACAVASESRWPASGAWQTQVAAIEAQLKQQLSAAAEAVHVADVRVLGAIGVIETTHPEHGRVAALLR